MAAPSEYNIEVESILGGLESALARGQPLKKAISSFRNAGYKEENIKEAVKKFQVLHQRKFNELAAPVSSPQKRIVGAVAGSTSEGAVQTFAEPEKEKARLKKGGVEKPRTLVTAKTREKLMEQYEREKIQMESKHTHSSRKPQSEIISPEEKEKSIIDKELEQEEARLEKTAEEAPVAPEDEPLVRRDKRLRKARKGRGKTRDSSSSGQGSRGYVDKPQVVSGYGGDAVTASENFRAAIDEMIKSLSKLAVPTPSPQTPQIIRERSSRRQKPQVINKISNYGVKPPTPVNKAVTFLLIFLLILLLGVLAAVFFFREELIDLFNTFTLEYFLPLLL